MTKRNLLLFVCTGNTCRSPLAKVLAEKILREEGQDNWRADSAGTAALYGMSASGQAIAAADALGLDLSLHQSKPLTDKLVREADLILTMTGAHKQAILQAAPEASGKVFTLAEFAGSECDVADPIGGSTALYLETAEHLQRLLGKATKKLPAYTGRKQDNKTSDQKRNAGRKINENSAGQ